jgi:hypothetical protein
MKAAADHWLQNINIQELQSKKHWEHKGELGHKKCGRVSEGSAVLLTAARMQGGTL